MLWSRKSRNFLSLFISQNRTERITKRIARDEARQPVIQLDSGAKAEQLERAIGVRVVVVDRYVVRLEHSDGRIRFRDLKLFVFCNKF